MKENNDDDDVSNRASFIHAFNVEFTSITASLLTQSKHVVKHEATRYNRTEHQLKLAYNVWLRGKLLTEQNHWCIGLFTWVYNRSWRVYHIVTKNVNAKCFRVIRPIKRRWSPFPQPSSKHQITLRQHIFKASASRGVLFTSQLSPVPITPTHPRRDGQAELNWLYGYMPRKFPRLRTIIHQSTRPTNRAQRIVTLWTEHNAFITTPNHYSCKNQQLVTQLTNELLKIINKILINRFLIKVMSLEKHY